MNGIDPWDQDTDLDGLDDDVDIDEDAEELAGQDDHPEHPEHDHPEHTEDDHPERAPERKLRFPRGRPAPRRATKGGAGKYRLRAMSPRMARSFPTAESVLITLRGGGQFLFVRKG